jgi:hypothetical protein
MSETAKPGVTKQEAPGLPVYSFELRFLGSSAAWASSAK